MPAVCYNTECGSECVGVHHCTSTSKKNGFCCPKFNASCHHLPEYNEHLIPHTGYSSNSRNCSTATPQCPAVHRPEEHRQLQREHSSAINMKLRAETEPYMRSLLDEYLNSVNSANTNGNSVRHTSKSAGGCAGVLPQVNGNRAAAVGTSIPTEVVELLPHCMQSSCRGGCTRNDYNNKVYDAYEEETGGCAIGAYEQRVDYFSSLEPIDDDTRSGWMHDNDHYIQLHNQNSNCDNSCGFEQLLPVDSKRNDTVLPACNRSTLLSFCGCTSNIPTYTALSAVRDDYHMPTAARTHNHEKQLNLSNSYAQLAHRHHHLPQRTQVLPNSYCGHELILQQRTSRMSGTHNTPHHHSSRDSSAPVGSRRPRRHPLEQQSHCSRTAGYSFVSAFNMGSPSTVLSQSGYGDGGARSLPGDVLGLVSMDTGTGRQLTSSTDCHNLSTRSVSSSSSSTGTASTARAHPSCIPTTHSTITPATAVAARARTDLKCIRNMVNTAPRSSDDIPRHVAPSIRNQKSVVENSVSVVNRNVQPEGAEQPPYGNDIQSNTFCATRRPLEDICTNVSNVDTEGDRDHDNYCDCRVCAYIKPNSSSTVKNGSVAVIDKQDMHRKRQHQAELFRQKVQQRPERLYEIAMSNVRERELMQRRHATIFSVRYPSYFGQNIYVVGSLEELGLWDPHRALPLKWSNGGVWRSVKIFLPRDVEFEYKYIVKAITTTPTASSNSEAVIIAASDDDVLSIVRDAIVWETLINRKAKTVKDDLGVLELKDVWDS
eukprot:Lankesteria_metandrocarpae@DN5287_c0_g1_i10.p1